MAGFGTSTPPTAVGGYFQSSTIYPTRELVVVINSRDLNDPPTPVSGIKNPFVVKFFSKDLNNPPTAVGGISDAGRLTAMGGDSDAGRPSAVGGIRMRAGPLRARDLSHFSHR